MYVYILFKSDREEERYRVYKDFATPILRSSLMTKLSRELTSSRHFFVRNMGDENLVLYFVVKNHEIEFTNCEHY